MIAYLSLINSTDDSLRLKRIINEPKRKIGNATVEAVESISALTGYSMFDVMSRAEEYTALAKSAEKLKSFCKMISDIRSRELRVSDLIPEIFEVSGYRDMLIAEGFEGETKIDHVNELTAGAIEYEKRCADACIEPTLSGYLEDIALVSDVDKYDESADAVVLMTVHSAKGLEFPIVFLAGMEDGIFPSEQNMMMEEEMSEERRLCYVAITRAKEKLYITYAKNRTMYGKTNYNLLSVFVRHEIPHNLIEKQMPRREPPRAESNYFASQYQRSQSVRTEMRRAPDIFKKTEAAASNKFGLEKLDVGCEVVHAMFGDGTIISSRDMGGDILYEVDFKSAGKKKLMATFAKLTRKGG